MEIIEEVFGISPCGGIAHLFSLKNANGMTVKITNFGGIITQVSVPDKFGKSANVCLGFNNIEDYYHNSGYFGALIGRYANRIENSQLDIHNQTVQLSSNDGQHHLHGGHEGINTKLWLAEHSCTESRAILKLHYLSQEGEEGYPGNCRIEATYELNEANELSLVFTATTDATTPLNLTQHSYFNLRGDGDISNHEVSINSEFYCPITESHIPTGEIYPVSGTVFDLRKPKRFADLLRIGDPQIIIANGLNHYFFIDRNPYMPQKELKFSATLADDISGRILKIYTNNPGLQLYSAGFLKKEENKTSSYGPHSGICFEPQYCPNSVNNPDLPDTLLHPGQTYQSETVFKFLTV